MENEDVQKTEAGTNEQMPNLNPLEMGPWLWLRFGFVVFFLILFYIYNQHHANKALRKKEMLIKELKELHSERISLESEVNKASKQSELALKLKETGIKELTKPPIKIEYRKEKK
jgi:hypothetical protein